MGPKKVVAIKQNGNSYLVSDYIPNPSTRVEIDFEARGREDNTNRNINIVFTEPVPPDYASFSLNFGQGLQVLYQLYFWQNITYEYGGTIATIRTKGEFIYGGRFQIKMGKINERYIGYISNGITTYQSDFAPKTTTNSRPICLFADGSMPNKQFACSVLMIYGFKIYENDILVSDFVPGVVNGVPTLVDMNGVHTMTPCGSPFIAVY